MHFPLNLGHAIFARFPHGIIAQAIAGATTQDDLDALAFLMETRDAEEFPATLEDLTAFMEIIADRLANSRNA